MSFTYKPSARETIIKETTINGEVITLTKDDKHNEFFRYIQTADGESYELGFTSYAAANARYKRDVFNLVYAATKRA